MSNQETSEALDKVQPPYALNKVSETHDKRLSRRAENKANATIFGGLGSLALTGCVICLLCGNAATPGVVIFGLLTFICLVGTLVNVAWNRSFNWNGYGPETTIIRQMNEHNVRRLAFNNRAETVRALGVPLDDGMKAFYLAERQALLTQQEHLSMLLQLHVRDLMLKKLAKMPTFGKQNTRLGETVDMSEAAFLARTEADVVADTITKVRHLPKG